jgi:molybdopterin adenylyltransferase
MNEIRFGILTVSDRSSQGVRPDASGPALEGIVTGQGGLIIHRQIVPDEMETIRKTLEYWSDSGVLDVILTTGGTGFGPRDVTPEATLAVIQRAAPGLAEAMRFSSLQATPHAMLSRATAGIRGRTLIVNLPGSPKGAMENLQVILPVLPHAVELLRNDPAAESNH